MTNDEAIYILHPDTTEEALEGLDYDEAMARVNEACLMAVRALKEQKKRRAKKCLHSKN